MAGLNPGLPAVPAGKQRRPQGQKLSDTGMAEPGRGKVLMAPASRGAPGPAAEGPAAAGRQCSPQRTSAALSAARNPQKASAIHQPAVPRIGRNTDCTVPVVRLQALTASPARPAVPAGFSCGIWDCGCICVITFLFSSLYCNNIPATYQETDRQLGNSCEKPEN